MKAATGEQVTAEELGGADLHCRLLLDYIKTLLVRPFTVRTQAHYITKSLSISLEKEFCVLAVCS